MKKSNLVSLAIIASLIANMPVYAQTAKPKEAVKQASKAPSRVEILETMKKATKFMVETVANNGGYVWAYSSDLSKRWGEVEAHKSMIWVQPPGTATMGHVYLDAYHATGDEYYYESAKKVAGALIAGQKPEGGWNYFIDFAGAPSTKKWYETIGKNAWRLEEFQHNWDNTTFDDAGTSESMQFLLRLYMEKLDPSFKPALEKSINLVLESQYPIGGWPQRYPLKYDHVKNNKADYTSYITFNDDVAGENINFLIMCYQAGLGGDKLLDAINRAMNVFIVTQQGQPQPGWGLQYSLDLKPQGARSYEPRALTTHTTAQNLKQLMYFYKLTGETKFLARVGEGIDWLEKLKLPADKVVMKGREYPTYIEIGTNKPLYVHRTGSNSTNGLYYADYNPEKPIMHYGQWRAIDIKGLRSEYELLLKSDPNEISKNSPIKIGNNTPLPKYFAAEDLSGTSDRNLDGLSHDLSGIIKDLNKEGYWPTPIKVVSNPYIGPAPKEVPENFVLQSHVGDKYDTSPYTTNNPEIGISTGAYIENMKKLISAIKEK